MSLSAKAANTGIEDSKVAPAVAEYVPSLELVLLALTFLFGFQTLRAVLPGFTWLLGDRFGLGPLLVLAVALPVFSTSFLASGLRRLAGWRLSIVLIAGGLGLVRLCLQVRWDEPLVGLILAMLGTAIFMLFLPIYLDRPHSHVGSPEITLGLLIGLVLDTSLHGTFSTYDLVWQPGRMPMLITSALVVIQWISLAAIGFTKEIGSSKPSAKCGARPLVWLAIGPFLFLQMVVFQNVARVAVLTSWPLPWAFGWTLLTQVAALGACVWVLNKKDHHILWPLALVCGIVLIAVTALSYPQAVWLAAPALLVGQMCLSLLIVLVLIGVSDRIGRVGVASVSTVFGFSMILFLVLVLGYYAVYLVHLPYHNTILEPIAASLVASCALVSCTSRLQSVRVGHKAWFVLGFTMVLLVLPLAGVLSWQEPSATVQDGFPVRIMTYNLHNGFNTEGTLDIEAVARVIEDNHPDIIALQEISRGWLVTGRLDMLTWLSQRLNMSYISGPTADPFWGSAIFSRYPIVQYENRELPSRGLAIRRGFISAVMDLGGGENLQVIAAHYHHSWDPEDPVEDDSDVRQLQSRAVIDFWNKANRTVLLGDLNAEPNAIEMVMLRQAGLVDLVARIEPLPAHTWPSDDPYVRLDHVLISPDLKARGVHVVASTASDHFPVLGIIDR